MVTPASARSLPSPNLLRKSLEFVSICIRDCHPLWSPIPRCSTDETNSLVGSYNPTRRWFRLFPFRSSLTQGISYDFFSSAYLDISVQRLTEPDKSGTPLARKVTPFGHERITASSQLPVHFRGVARPSSAYFVKASTKNVSSYTWYGNESTF